MSVFKVSELRPEGVSTGNVDDLLSDVTLDVYSHVGLTSGKAQIKAVCPNGKAYYFPIVSFAKMLPVAVAQQMLTLKDSKGDQVKFTTTAEISSAVKKSEEVVLDISQVLNVVSKRYGSVLTFDLPSTTVAAENTTVAAAAK